jgi:hypothetical protein
VKYKLNYFLLVFFLLLLIACGKNSKTTEQRQRKIDGIDIKDILDADPSWSYVTDLSQLDGIWEGFYSEIHTTLISGITVKFETEVIQTVDASVKNASLFIKSNQTFHGDTIDKHWASIKGEYAAGSKIIMIDDVNHQITVTVTQDVSKHYSDENISQTLASTLLQINKTGDKIRYPSGGYDGEEPHIIILSKIE